jgi:hypothetical protein
MPFPHAVCLFPADIPTKILYALFIYDMHAVCPSHITVIWFRLPFSKTWIPNIRISPLYVQQRLYQRIPKDLQQGWSNVTELRACLKFQTYAGVSRYMTMYISCKINNKIQSIHKIHFYIVKQWCTKRCLSLITEWSDRTAQNIKISYLQFSATDCSCERRQCILLTVFRKPASQFDSAVLKSQ